MFTAARGAAVKLPRVCYHLSGARWKRAPRVCSGPRLDVLRAKPHALVIFLQPPERKAGPLIGRLLPHLVVEKRVALEDDLKNPLAVARRRDDVVNVCRDATVGIRTRFDRAEFIAALPSVRM